MAVGINSPLTGAAVSGLTTPTYTFAVDSAPNLNGKQFAVTALGGTQTGVNTHSVSKPFTCTWFRPAVLKQLPQANPVTGIIKEVPVNQWKLVTRKGALAAADTPTVMRMTTIIEIGAGAETFSINEMRAMESAHIGALWQQASGLSDTTFNNLL